MEDDLKQKAADAALILAGTPLAVAAACGICTKLCAVGGSVTAWHARTGLAVCGNCAFELRWPHLDKSFGTLSAEEEMRQADMPLKRVK